MRGSHRLGRAATLACPGMDLEITPEPTAEERAAIAAVLAEDVEPQPASWSPGDAQNCEEIVNP